MLGNILSNRDQFSINYLLISMPINNLLAVY